MIVSNTLHKKRYHTKIEDMKKYVSIQWFEREKEKKKRKKTHHSKSI